MIPGEEMWQSPSDLLAAIAAALVQSEVRTPTLTGKRDWITQELQHDYRPESHWRKSMGDLRRLPAIACLPDPIVPAADVPAMIDLVRAAQILDIWHMPLISAAGLVKTEEHVRAADRLADHGRLNISAELGFLLPALAGGGPGPLDLDLWHEPLARISRHTPGALWPWLDSTTFLPRWISGQESKRMGDPGPAEQRRIEVKFDKVGWADIFHPHLSRDPKIAIAPLVQGGSEVRFVPSPNGKRYSLAPVYPETRLRHVVRQAIEAEAELLFIPEMAVPAAHLSMLAACLPAEAEDHYQRTREISRLAYVLAGVTEPGAEDRPGLNFLVVLNARGEELFRQSKLSHWDINSTQQKIFGLDRLDSRLANPVEEDTEPGSVLHIRDIDGLGRIVNCICSDLNQDMPLDWLILNGRLDWLHAAIMDKSLCWGKSPANPPWAVRRAERAAVDLRGRLVVTNSIGLTEWVNEANERAASPYGRYDAAGVALCLDSSGRHIMQKLVFSEVGSASPAVVACEAWRPDRWDRFPHPPFN
jgi:predicted amidohydrolase